MEKRDGKKKIAVLAVACLLLGAGIGSGGMAFKYRDELKFAEKFKILAETDKFMTEKKAKMNRADEMDELVVNGYLSAYDKYSYFYIDSVMRNRMNLTNGSPSLISCGYQVDLNEDGMLYISYVEPESAAEQQGLCEGDIILKINENDLINGVEGHVKELMGKDGTMMTLKILRGTEEKTIEFRRVILKENNTRGLTAEIIEDDILYISISSIGFDLDMTFNEKAVPLVKDARGIILDLRNNPGGGSGAAVEVADRFIGESESVDYYYTGETTSESTNDSESDIKLPVVVLCNEKTASAAEVLLALLMQYGENVKSVGMKTVGKGVFQEDDVIGSNGVIHYTAGYYTVGEWECYNGKGIEPDITVEMDAALIGTDEDIQLQKAIELLG